MIRIIVYTIFFVCFISVNALGWNWSSEIAASWMKIHPATYLSFLAFGIGLLSLDPRCWRSLFTMPYAPFGFMALVLVARGAMIAISSRDPTGAVSVALTTFLTPFLFLVASVNLTAKDWSRLGQFLHIFMIVNSLVALGESLSKTSLVFVQEGHLFRSGSLIGHPLSSAMITGFMLVYLLTAANRRSGFLTSLPEIFLHAAAMFTYGGRTGLLLVPLVVIISAILPNPGAPLMQRVSQRATIALLVVAGIIITQLQIDIVQTAMERFQSDSGSTEMRFATLRLINNLSFNDLMAGINPNMRANLISQYNITVLENPYISLIVMFGIILTAGMVAALLYVSVYIAHVLDRSAYFIIIYFFIYTMGNISFGTRSVSILQMLIFILGLCQPRILANGPIAARRGDRLLS